MTYLLVAMGAYILGIFSSWLAVRKERRYTRDHIATLNAHLVVYRELVSRAGYVIKPAVPKA